MGSGASATARGLFCGGQAVGHIMLAKTKEDAHILGWLFRTKFAASDGAMAVEVRKEDVASGKLEVKVAFHDRPCELCSMKVDAEKGGTFWGGTKDVTKPFYPYR